MDGWRASSAGCGDCCYVHTLTTGVGRRAYSQLIGRCGLTVGRSLARRPGEMRDDGGDEGECCRMAAAQRAVNLFRPHATLDLHVTFHYRASPARCTLAVRPTTRRPRRCVTDHQPSSFVAVLLDHKPASSSHVVNDFMFKAKANAKKCSSQMDFVELYLLLWKILKYWTTYVCCYVVLMCLSCSCKFRAANFVYRSTTACRNELHRQ